ncbi:Glucan endo-1,3-beta-glucosidase 4 [Hibiscus syriacus]|uniref:glucan endo-1,3-beta-D-glucosidase n=1 Tax=Hibiscus syriacus TaxID=106335 RepID=A0A6A2WUC3_HIBSY|nr:Glucan endo-1,3-beta-glucosidase 4 [Hibiscus syriacus]
MIPEMFWKLASGSNWRVFQCARTFPGFNLKKIIDFIGAFVGVNIGTDVSSMPSASDVVSIIRAYQIIHVRLYDAGSHMLKALAGSGVEVIVGVTNEEVLGIGQSTSTAAAWVNKNVASYVPATNITAIAVGSEVLSSVPHVAPVLVSAMNNLHKALVASDLNFHVKVSSPQSLDIIPKPFPPSTAAFNASPNSTIYQLLHMFDVMVDATYYSMDALNFSGIPVVVTETGWPSQGPPSRLNIPINTYIYELFNEDKRPGPIMGNSTSVFCVEKDDASEDKLQDGLNWACGQGKTNCSVIQSGQPCYLPNSIKNHASYAYNDYYQKTHSVGVGGTCDFDGTATVTTDDPSYRSCMFTGSSNSSAGRGLFPAGDFGPLSAQEFIALFNGSSRLPFLAMKILGIDGLALTSTHRRAKLGKHKIFWKNLHGATADDFRIQTKVKTKQTCFKEFLQCNDDEERSRAIQRYKEAKREAKKTVAKTKDKAYEEMYKRLDTKEGQNDIFRLAKSRENKKKRFRHSTVDGSADYHTTVNDCPTSRIGFEEVKMTLRKMGRDKAVGPDQILITVWLALGEEGVKWLTNIFNIILETAKMPEEWRESTVMSIYKNKGDPQRCGNYKGRSTTEAIHLLRWLMEKYRGKNRDLHMAFIDLEKAYDSVHRDTIWKTLETRQIPTAYIRAIRDMYSRSTTYVRTTVGDTKAFPVEIGLHQGSALSPYIFALIMDDIYCATPDGVPWCMFFANDIVLVAETKTELNSRLAACKTALEEKGLRINIEMIEYLCSNFSGNQIDEDVENGNKTNAAVWIRMLGNQEGSRKKDEGRRNENASMGMWEDYGGLGMSLGDNRRMWSGG